MGKIYLSLALISAIISCTPKQAPDNMLGGRKWTLIEMDGRSVQLADAEKEANLIFTSAEKRFSGSGGCNRISGPYSTDHKGKLTFGLTISTKMMCPDISFEDKFLATFPSVTDFEIKDGQLLLKKEEQILLKFR